MSQTNRQRLWYLANRERLLAEGKEYRENNKEKIAETLSNWCRNNREKSNAIKRRWALNNKDKDRACKDAYAAAHPERRRQATGRRRARRLGAIPPWITVAQRKEMAKIYRGCPVGHEVDHMLPLQSKHVCGLHVPWNLQYLTVAQNRAKKNKYEGQP